MPLFKRLFSTKTESNKRYENQQQQSSNNNVRTNDKNCVTFKRDQIRVLLFKECERRGESKLLFDSVSVEKTPAKSRCGDLRNSIEQRDDIWTEFDDEFIYEYKRIEREDVKFLKEMVFGSVAMTYRGPSFKIHAMDSPRRIMCTKVFPVAEHASNRQSERTSSETLGNSLSLDTGSSSGSMLAVVSQSNLVNSYGNRLSPELRKNSTSSSTGSSWDIDISLAPPAGSSSQSLESSGSSGVGSLSSLRRRWLRAMSTSLSRAESEDFFGIQYSSIDGASCESNENRGRRQRTRIGLAVLIELTKGHEWSMEARLLEHVALLEGMLDRLRRSCNRRGQNKGKGLVRMYRASMHCTLWLLRLFMDSTNLPAPLLWHKVLLTSNTSGELKVHTLHRSLQLMSRLFDDVDTKSTNFFLSTLVTAVLTHHLGWVHTVLSSSDRKLVETLAKRYPCNPLWAQLCDLYGALGTPLRVTHTVIVGETEKTDLINTVLTFLSYFIRSGNIERRRERRCSPQRELEAAVVLLTERETKRPLSSKPKLVSSGYAPSITETRFRRKFSEASKRRANDIPNSVLPALLSLAPSVSQNVQSKASRLKRSESKLQNLNAIALDSAKLNDDSCVKHESLDVEGCGKLPEVAKDQNSNSVKIVVSETPPLEREKQKEYLQRSAPLQELENKIDYWDFEEAYPEAKLESLERQSENDFDANKLGLNGIDVGDSSLPDPNQGNFGKEEQVRFVLGGEDKSKLRSQEKYYCQCAFSFPRVPSTSAQLSEGVLRKIIQRNFPESSKSIKTASTASDKERSAGLCPNCCGASFASSHPYEGNNLLETPTNATEVLRTCGSGSSVNNRGVRLNRYNSLEYLMEANGVVELPMPRSKKLAANKGESSGHQAGFAGSLKFGEVRNASLVSETNTCDTSGYTWGLVAQGISKRKKKKRRKRGGDEELNSESEEEWLGCVRDEVEAAARSSIVDQPVAEALCIVADVDNWQVGILSSNTPSLRAPLPVGMSRLVGNMIEAFAYVWRKYHSPIHCVGVLEGKLREMWLRSAALAEMLMGAELEDVSVDSLTDALDLDAADIPVLLAVATTHSPLVARRFGLSLAYSPTTEPKISIIEAKNKIRLGHDESCSCCCCCTPQPTCYKYVQPEKTKSFAPIRYYYKPDVPMDDNTTYRLSYWEGPSAPAEPFHPEDNLVVGGGEISDDTTHRLSYLGNWCVKPETPITPCQRKLLGRGPMQDVTTQKHDYTWKLVPRTKPFKGTGNIYSPCATMSDDTTYRMSYYNYNCLSPVKSYAPIRQYFKSDVPMDGCTTYKLSYWPTEAPVKEEYPWCKKGEYHPPVNPMDGCTTYKLSYWPNCGEKPRKPFTTPDTENILNAKCCFDDKTTYRLSYFGCETDAKRQPIKHSENLTLSSCPFSHDTTNRLSYPGNWCPKPEAPITPCQRQLLGRGPMQDVTTQKHDYTWKCAENGDGEKFRPVDNLEFSPLPLECCTTHRVSFMPINKKSLVPIRSYAPERKYWRSEVPMEGETTMKLSYQPVEVADKVDKPWGAKQSYHPPSTPMADNTTYNLSYIPPGTLVPLPPNSPPCPQSKTCTPCEQRCR